MNAALRSARQAATILEAPPHDPVAGYSDDEIAAQYAATDRLLTAFRQLDAEIKWMFGR